MKLLFFISSIIIVSCLSDLGLNYISHQSWSPETIAALRTYFDKRGPIASSLYAGLTVFIVLLPTILLSHLLFGYDMPVNAKQLNQFLLLAFPIGYISDVIVNRYKIFGHDLDEYYKIAGEGFWGAIAFLFAIIFGWFITNANLYIFL